jgi:hypothetical protein
MLNQTVEPLGVTTVPCSGVTAIKLTVPAGANLALIVAETGSLRWRDDGTPPTASTGMLLGANLTPFEYSGNVAGFQAIGVTGTTAVSVAFYASRG